MPTDEDFNWRRQCYGRHELLKKLQDAYRRADAQVPQFLVLKGIPGVGKTRIVQEFYRWLSTEVDTQGYWPDLLISEATKDRVNPIFDERNRCPIPFLWLGVKFDEPLPAPSQGNAETSPRIGTSESGKALRDAMPHLMPHTIEAITKREIRKIHGDWLWKSFGIAMAGVGMLPGVGLLANIPEWVKSGWEVWKHNQQKQAAESRSREPVFKTLQQMEQDAIEPFLSTLRLFLDDSQTDRVEGRSTRIPVVLFLDDAHWGDSLTMTLVQQLWAEARSRKWPLLVVATYWEDEWDVHQQLPDGGSVPLKLAHFPQRVDPEGRSGGITELDVRGLPIDYLRAWLKATLPGVTPPQQQVILQKAGEVAKHPHGSRVPEGIPRVLESLIQWLLEDPEEAFVHGDKNGPLCDDILKTIDSEVFDLNEIVRLRFKNLPREVRLALGWGSEQGRRFLAEINQAIARQLPNVPDDSVAFQALRQAETPHHWIEGIPQTIQGESRFNLCDFRSNVFREVARKHYSKSPETIKAVQEALSTVLAAWLDTGRMDPPENPDLIGTEQLTVSERRDVLQICINHFRPLDPSQTPEAQWRVYGNALARLTELDVSGFKWDESIFWERAVASAVEFASARPGGWDRSLVDIFWQIAVVDVLWQMHRYDLAEQLLISIHRQTQDQARNIRDYSSARQYALICERLAMVHEKKEGPDLDALSLYRESLDVRRSIVTEFGRSPQSLRDVSVSLNKVADAMRGVGISELTIDGASRDALLLHRESLDVRRSIVTEFGRSPESLRDVSVSLNKVADAMRGVGISELTIDGVSRNALSLYRESLDVCRSIVTEFGGSPESLRDVSISLDRVADAMRDVGISELTIDGASRDALSLYWESLDFCRSIVTEFGRSPESLRDVSVSLDRVADAMRGVGISELTIDGASRDALSLYRESLDVCRSIVTEFGRSPQSLRDVSISLEKVADAMRGVGIAELTIDGASREALSLYRESLDVRRSIVTEFGRSPQSLRDVSISLDRVADAMRGVGISELTIDGASREALSLYRESLDVRRSIVTEFGRSPASLHDLFISYSRMILIFGEAGDPVGLKEFLTNARQVLDEIHECGWENTQTQQCEEWLDSLVGNNGSTDEPGE